RRAERVAFPGIRERGVIGGLRDAERLGRDADAAGVQHRHRDAEALTFLAEPVLDRAAVVVQLDLAGRGCADAELRLRFAAYEPRLLRVDDERADARVFARALGAGEQDDVARHRPGRDPGFLAVDDVMRAVRRQHRPRAHRGGIRARLRLRERVGTVHLARGDRHQKLPLLLLGAEIEQRRPVQRVVDRDDRAVCGVGGGDLLDHERVADRVRAGAAVFLGYLDPHETELAGLADGLGGKLAGFVEAGGDRGDLALRELAGRRLDHLLLFAE